MVVSVQVIPRQISRTVLAVTPYLGAMVLHSIMLPRAMRPLDILGRRAKISRTSLLVSDERGRVGIPVDLL
jgi:hypothetical protein